MSKILGKIKNFFSPEEDWVSKFSEKGTKGEGIVLSPKDVKVKLEPNVKIKPEPKFGGHGKSISPPNTPALPPELPKEPSKEVIMPILPLTPYSDKELENVQLSSPIPEIKEIKEKEVKVEIEVKERILIAPAKERLLLSSPPIVSFDKVTKKFGDKVAIQDVTFDVYDKTNAGEMIAIVGPSGCGKSTILRIIAGLTPQFPHTSGTVKVMGKEVVCYGSDRGVVDQKYSLLPNLTVCENISFGLRLQGVGRKERKERAIEWVKKIHLEGSEEKYPHELSGGMQQRVSLAATLILKPQILLMDEPFGALDPKTRLSMQELLVDLWREMQSTVFIVTHSMEEAVYLGDRVFRMESNPGRLIEILDLPRPDISPEEMRKKKWFNEIVQELLKRIETGSGSKGSLYKKTKDDKNLNEDELELFKLIG